MIEKTVFMKDEEQNLATSMGSGTLEVLATPCGQIQNCGMV